VASLRSLCSGALLKSLLRPEGLYMSVEDCALRGLQDSGKKNIAVLAALHRT